MALHTAEGRSFVRRTPDRFDVIQASLVDTWAATAAGAFALTENTLYTLEAFGDYYQHLSDAGVVAMSRWNTDAETKRLLLLAAGALERAGVAAGETRKHIYYAAKDGLGTLLAKRTAFAPDELARLDAACADAGFKVVLSPTSDGGAALARLVDAGAWSALVRAERADLSPPTDDRPFFFFVLKPSEVWSFARHFGHGAKMDDPAVWMLIALGVSLVGLTAAFIVLPLVLHRRAALVGGGAGGPRRRAMAIAYFALLGLAFITVEVALLQKFTFFLGHPAYSLVVVLFSILLATAIGARLSERLPTRFVVGTAAVLAVVCAIYATGLGDLLRAWVGWGLGARIVASGLLIAVCGGLMGVMLPAGIRALGERDAELVPWAWGINGAASVVGTVSATLLAIQLGFRVTLVVGAALYLLAGIAVYALRRLAERDEERSAIEATAAVERQAASG